MRVLKTTALRHATSFDNVQLNVSAHRDVFMIRGNGGDPDIEIVTSEVITTDDFRDEIERVFGPTRHFENYVDPRTGHEVLRGCVHHDGMQKVFYQRYDELTRDILNDVIKSLELTKRMESL